MMELKRLDFTKNWEDPADYPTYETSEVQVRKDIQSLYTEIRTYINEVLLPALESLGNESVQGGAILIPGDVLRKSGGTMTGPLYLAREPREKSEAATKTYVDESTGLVAKDAAAGIAALTVRAGKIESAVLDAEGNIAQLTQKATGLESLVQSAQGDISQIQQAVGEISLSVTEQAGADGTVSAKITLKIGPNSYSGYIRLTGNVDVSGQLSAQALYAARGDIAALTVDSLSTSRRIAKFLAGDTTDDNYIRIREQTVDFVSGVYAGGRLQAATPEGMPLYWEDEVYESTEVTLGEDGYPSKNGGRIFTTTAVTDYPVYVYRYAELIKQSLCFGVDTLTGDYAPIGIFGAGDESGANRGYILKRRSGFDLRYLPPAGEEIGIHMGADGYMDLTGLRRTTKLDLSRWDEGVFTETVEGGETVTYTVTFKEVEGERVPMKISDGTGHETAICWKEGS